MRARAAIASAGLMLALAPGASAQDAGLTGGQVLSRCQSTEAAEVSWCVGFAFGVAQVIGDASTDKQYRACYPADFTAEVARLVVVRGLEAEPKLQDLSGSHAVWYVLRKSFPCET